MSAITICNGVFLHTPHFLLLECFVRRVQVFTSFIAGLKRASELELLVASGAAPLPEGYFGCRSQHRAVASVLAAGMGCPITGAARHISCEACTPVARTGRQGAFTTGCTVGCRCAMLPAAGGEDQAALKAGGCTSLRLSFGSWAPQPSHRLHSISIRNNTLPKLL